MGVKKIAAALIASILTVSCLGYNNGIESIFLANKTVAHATEEKNAQGYVKLDTLKEDPNAPEPKKSKNKNVTYIEGVMIVNKTYDLPSDFVPEDMHTDSTCQLGSGYNGTNGLDNTAYAQAIKMLKGAEADGITLKVVSGYRSYDYQDTLYNTYVSQKGKDKADASSARPGHSEHQTGLSIDFNDASSNFDSSKEAKWLKENAYKYGFIVRFPEGKSDKTGFKYESWHVRYIGGAKAKAVYESGVTLEEYLGLTSKYGDTKKDGDPLDAPTCAGNTGAGGENNWKKKSTGEGDVGDWLNVKDDWRHGIHSTSSGDSESGGKSTGHGKATGQYAIELNDGSWYWYHQGSDGCDKCGSWNSKSWGPGSLASCGCPVYSTAEIVSNLTGKEVTPAQLLIDAGSTEYSTYFSNGRLNPGGFAGEAAVISEIEKNYGLKGEAIDWSSKEAAKSQVDEILDKGGMILYYHYYGSDKGMYHLDGSWWPAWTNGSYHFIPIRSRDSNGYYLLDECQTNYDLLNQPVSWDAIWKCKVDGSYGACRTMIGFWNEDAE